MGGHVNEDLYQWLRTQREADGPIAAAAEVRRLRSALCRMTEERDILSRRSRNQRSNTMLIPPAAR